MCRPCMIARSMFAHARDIVSAPHLQDKEVSHARDLYRRQLGMEALLHTKKKACFGSKLPGTGYYKL